MPSPFPGMDPHLEEPGFWRSFHHHFTDEVARQLNPQIVPKYFADVEVERVELPQPEKVRTVQIYERESQRLVTAIEILSPVNKSGDGLQKYQQKRLRILRSDVHLVEIDLLRRGQRPGQEVRLPPLDTDYVLLVNRANSGSLRHSDIWPLALNNPLPTLPIPLLSPDPDATLNLAAVLTTIYDDFYYALRLDYTKAIPPPELRPAMQEWFAELRATSPFTPQR